MLGEILNIVSKFGPQLLKAFGVGGVGALIPILVAIVEKLIPGKGRGEEKFAAVQAIAKLLIQLSEMITGKDIFDDAQAAEGIDNLINGAVQFYNSVNAWPDIPLPTQ